jgi:hypothetical protein
VKQTWQSKSRALRIRARILQNMGADDCGVRFLQTASKVAIFTFEFGGDQGKAGLIKA